MADHFVAFGRGSFHLHFAALGVHDGFWRHAFEQPDVAADDRVATDGDRPENRRAGVEGNVVFDVGMPLDAFDDAAFE